MKRTPAKNKSAAKGGAGERGAIASVVPGGFPSAAALAGNGAAAGRYAAPGAAAAFVGMAGLGAGMAGFGAGGGGGAGVGGVGSVPSPWSPAPGLMITLPEEAEGELVGLGSIVRSSSSNVSNA